MNENLFTFPGGTADASGDNPFDLSGFTELTGSNTQNPFADLLAGGEATEQPPAEGAGAVQADDSIPEEKDETDQNHETVEEDESHEISKSPAPQDPQPKSPPAPKSEEDHASDKPEEAEDNPRLAAMERQEEKTAPKVAEPIFAQLPVFSYNGSEAPIEDTEQTFDELRLSKLTDFPEFDEAQSLSWKVVYGKIVKEIVLPKKTKIGQIKREIETSKEFINALKKATDKHPKCLVKPSISMQKKGDASAYKGAFLYLSEAQASPKTITFIPGRDGKVYHRLPLPYPVAGAGTGRPAAAPDGCPREVFHGGQMGGGLLCPTALSAVHPARLSQDYRHQLYHFCHLRPPDVSVPDDRIADAEMYASAVFHRGTAPAPCSPAADRGRLGDSAILPRYPGGDGLYPGRHEVAGCPGAGPTGGHGDTSDGVRHRDGGGALRSGGDPGN